MEYKWEEALELLKENDWLFSAHPNDFFKPGTIILERLNVLYPERYSTDQLIDYLIDPKECSTVSTFVTRCAELALFSSLSDENVSEKTRFVSKGGTCSKKTYEVELMAPFLKNMAMAMGIRSFVDIGAGQGYLDYALLELLPDIRITAVERDHVQVKGFLERRHSSCQDSSHRDRLAIVTSEISDETRTCDFQAAIQNEPYLMYSLHACGSLSDHMIRLFLEDQNAKALVGVGCCYNLITSSVLAYPLSRLFKSKNAQLSPLCKMAACQAVQRWPSTREDVKIAIQKNFYRSILQTLSLRSCKVKRKAKATMSDSFAEYCRLFLKESNSDIPEEQLDHAEREFAPWERQFSLFWTLRACLGRVIESLIIYDRYLYLKESLSEDSQVAIVPLFSPLQSPRRFVIQAIK